MSARPIREGFHTVTPYLFATGAARLIQFLSEAFNAQLVSRKDRPDGAIMHAELRIGDSMLMLADAAGEFGPMPTSIYLYVTDCDRVYRQALAAGGLSISEVMNFSLRRAIRRREGSCRKYLVDLRRTSRMSRKRSRRNAGGPSNRRSGYEGNIPAVGQIRRGQSGLDADRSRDSQHGSGQRWPRAYVAAGSACGAVSFFHGAKALVTPSSVRASCG
jgi:predicted enzyme related to lactoylglutathione lyase